MLKPEQIEGKVVNQENAKRVTIQIDPNKDEYMSLYEFSRWNCLLEAVDYIDQKANQMKYTGDWVKPIALQKYIDERTPGMLHEIAIQRGVSEVFEPV